MTAVTVALAGDCMATRGSLITDDPGSLAVREVLAGADFAFANLEVVPSEGAGFPQNNAAGGGCLIAGSAVLDEIRAMGFSVLGCANNHALDMGVGGLLGTMDLLRARGMAYAGVGRDLTRARMPACVDGPHGSLAVISCASTFSPGHEASESSGELPGRPGLNPLRHRVVLKVTPGQLSALEAIDDQTGLAARRAEAVTLLGVDPVRAVPGSLSLFGTRFQVSERPGLETACEADDLSAISEWVRDARWRADAVLVSVHSHEPGPSPEDPGEFLREFAHRVIDCGADAVVGHGPHFLKGVEIYRGKPIFFSLGNIVSQIELGRQIPAEDYARVPAADRASPARYFAARSKNDAVLFAPRRKYWESVIPVLTLDDGNLASVVLHPVDLGFGAAVHRRGRPRLADMPLGTEILGSVARMSAPYGTRLKEEKQDGHVVGVISGPVTQRTGDSADR